MEGRQLALLMYSAAEELRLQPSILPQQVIDMVGTRLSEQAACSPPTHHPFEHEQMGYPVTAT
jgi:hypothetical protein